MIGFRKQSSNQCSWYSHQSALSALTDYFQKFDLVIALNINVMLYDTPDQVPEELKQHAKPSGQTMNFNVQSKLEEEEFNEELHGDPNELFNKFDLTQGNVDIGAIKEYIGTNKVDLNKRNENGTVCSSSLLQSRCIKIDRLMCFLKTDVFVLCSG